MGQKIANDRVELELSSFPVVCAIEQGPLNNAERVAMMEALDELVDKRGRHALLLDLSKALPMPNEQRTFVAEAFQMRADSIADKWAAVAVVVREPLLANLPTGAFWVRVCPVPTKVFTKLEEAQAWLRQCLNQRASGAAQLQGLGVNKRRVTNVA